MQRPNLSRVLPTIADAASVVFVATCVLILAAVAGEARSPGMAASMLSPQLLLVIAVAAGLVSLAGERAAPASAGARIGYAMVGIVVMATAASLAWNYFAPFASARSWLTAASAVTAASLFILSRRPKTAA